MRDDLSERKAPFFTHGRAAYWLALRDGRPVGRISAQIDSAAQAIYRAPIGFFGFLDAEDDPEAFAALIAQAEGWLRAEGCTRAWGPLSHTLWEMAGLLLENFTDPGVFLMPYAPPYAARHVEAAGYAKVKDLHAWIVDVGTQLARAKPLRPIPKLQVRPLNEADYAGDIRRVVEIFNDAWSENWGFVPFTDTDIAHLAKSLKPILDPRIVVIAEYEGEPAAMAIGLPNLLEAARDLNGRLFPLGWAKLLWRLKANKLEIARVPLMGLRKKHHNTFLGAAILRALFLKLDEGLAARRFRRLEMSWILEDNRPMIQVLKGLGGENYKTYRVYEKVLS